MHLFYITMKIVWMEGVAKHIRGHCSNVIKCWRSCVLMYRHDAIRWRGWIRWTISSRRIELIVVISLHAGIPAWKYGCWLCKSLYSFVAELLAIIWTYMMTVQQIGTLSSQPRRLSNIHGSNQRVQRVFQDDPSSPKMIIGDASPWRQSWIWATCLPRRV